MRVCGLIAYCPPVWPIVATALVASIGDARQFKSGRELAAWTGLVPRQYSTGGKAHLGGVGRRANHYLLRQLVHGARAVALRLKTKSDSVRGASKPLSSVVASTRASWLWPTRPPGWPGPCWSDRRTTLALTRAPGSSRSGDACEVKNDGNAACTAAFEPDL